MEKKNIYKFLYLVSIFLILIFIIMVGMDFMKYNPDNNSAPFYTFVIERALVFILPSIIIFTIGTITKRKYRK